MAQTRSSSHTSSVVRYECSTVVVEFGILAKPLQRQRVSSSTWIDVESLRAAKLYLHEDEEGYSATVKASHQKRIKLLYRVVMRFQIAERFSGGRPVENSSRTKH